MGMMGKRLSFLGLVSRMSLSSHILALAPKAYRSSDKLHTMRELSTRLEPRSPNSSHSPDSPQVLLAAITLHQGMYCKFVFVSWHGIQGMVGIDISYNADKVKAM